MNIQPREVRRAEATEPEPEPGAEYGTSHVILQRQIDELRARVDKLEAARALDENPPIPQEVREENHWVQG